MQKKRMQNKRIHIKPTVDPIINVKCPDQTCLYFERIVKKWHCFWEWVNFLESKNNVDFTKMYFLK